jgi:hypothetical protein
MKPGFEEVKRIIARSPNVIKIKPEMDFQEGQITRAMNKAIREAERSSAQLAAQVRLINEKSFVFEPRVKFSPEAVKVRVAEMVRTAKERAAQEQIEIQAKIKYAEDSRILGPQTRSLTARGERVAQLSVDDRAFRNHLAGVIREARAELHQNKLTLDIQTRLVGTGDLEAEATQRFASTRNMVARPNSPSGRAGGREGHRGLASFNPFSQRGLERAFGFAAAGFVVTEGARLAGDYFSEENRRLRSSSNVANQAQARLNTIQFTKSIPVLGITAQVADQITGASTAQQRVIDDENQRVAAGEASRVLSRSQAANIAGLRGDTVGAIRLGAEQRISDAKKISLLSGDINIVKQEEEIRDLQIKQESERQAFSIYATEQGTRVSNAQILASRAARSGDGDRAFALRQNAETLQLKVAGEQKLVGVVNPQERRNIAAQNEDALARQAEQHETEAEERKKKRAVDIASAVAATANATLRIQQKNYEADLQAFDEATQEKLMLIDDLAEKQNEATRRAAERSVAVANHEREIAESVAIAKANTSANELRIQRRDYEADKVTFEANAKTKLDAIEDPRLKKAAQDEIDSQRKLMEETHNRQQTDFVLSYQTRIAEAQARGGFHDRVAGEIGGLSGMAAELRAVSPENRGQLIATQRAELQAEQDRILRPRSGGRATEVDVHSMAFSDPFSDTKEQDTEILKLIAGYLKSIDDKSGGGARLN